MLKNKIEKLLSDFEYNVDKLNEEDLSSLISSLKDSYNKGKPLIEDDAFDYLVQIMELKYPENKILEEMKGSSEDSILPYYMPSLDKVRYQNPKEFESWYQKMKCKNFVVTEKLDGNSALLYKNEENEIFIYSKGTGYEPKNVALYIDKIFFGKIKVNSFPKNLAVRGELIIKKSNWIGEITTFYKNSRSAINGLLSDSKKYESNKKIIDFVAYDRYDNIKKFNYEDYEDLLLKLKETGFNIPWYEIFNELDQEEISSLLSERREESDYIIDGLVLRCNKKPQLPGKNNPKDAVAFKKPSQFVETTVKYVEWNTKSGNLLAPLIYIEPVYLDGITIKKITGNNASFIINNKIGKGSKVTIEKKGDIIPGIKEVLEGKTPDLPTNIRYKWDKNKKNIYSLEEDEIASICEIARFFSKIKVPLLGIGTVKKLYDNGYDTICKILSAKKEELYDIEGLGEQSVNNIDQNLTEALSNAKLEDIMAGSFFFGRNLGSKKLKIVVEEIPDIVSKKFTTQDEVEKEFRDKLLSLNGFNEITVNTFINNYLKFRTFLQKLRKTKRYFPDYGDISGKKIEKKIEKIEESPLLGKTVVFTNFRDASLSNKIEKLGGKIGNSVSKKTNFVIYPNNKNNSSSIDKAKKLSIPIMEKDEFINNFNL